MTITCVTCERVHDVAEYTASELKRPSPRCRPCAREKYLRWKNKDLGRYRRSYARGNRLSWADPVKREKMKAAMNRRNRALRDGAFMALGDRCACCGEVNSLFLQIDHIHNDGWTHRKRLGNGIMSNSQYRLYKEILSGKTEGLQLLCANCNWGKARNNGICPHEEERLRKPRLVKEKP